MSFGKEYLFTAFTHLERLRDLIPAREITIGHKSFASMVLQSLRGVNIPFRGEPLAGLQIMGVLETRALDFDRLIICP
jgi:inactivated superfamily I helicase